MADSNAQWRRIKKIDITCHAFVVFRMAELWNRKGKTKLTLIIGYSVRTAGDLETMKHYLHLQLGNGRWKLSSVKLNGQWQLQSTVSAQRTIGIRQIWLILKWWRIDVNGLVFQYISTDRVNATAAVISNLLSLHTEKLRCRSLFIAFKGLKDTLGL